MFGTGNCACRAQKLYVAHVFASSASQGCRVAPFAQVSSALPLHRHLLYVVREIQFRNAAVVDFGGCRGSLKGNPGCALGVSRRLETLRTALAAGVLHHHPNLYPDAGQVLDGDADQVVVLSASGARWRRRCASPAIRSRGRPRSRRNASKFAPRRELCFDQSLQIGRHPGPARGGRRQSPWSRPRRRACRAASTTHKRLCLCKAARHWC